MAQARAGSGSSSPATLPRATTWADKLRTELGDTPPTLTLSVEVDSPIPIFFPSSDKSLKAEADLLKIRQYLSNLRQPAGLLGNDLEKFVNRARRFVMIDARGWRDQN